MAGACAGVGGVGGGCEFEEAVQGGELTDNVLRNLVPVCKVSERVDGRGGCKGGREGGARGGAGREGGREGACVCASVHTYVRPCLRATHACTDLERVSRA